MALLYEMQRDLMDQSVPVGGTLLKLRYLASKLGSDLLENWVKFETEGYPDLEVVPPYRITAVSYRGTFTDMIKQLTDVSVPPHLIEKFCGESWINYGIRDALTVIDSSVSRANEDTKFSLDTGNVKLLIEGKIYPGMACVEVHGTFDINAFIRIQHAVRAKVLDLTLELEKSIPSAASIEIGQSQNHTDVLDTAHVTQITQNIFYGSVTNVHSSGDNNKLKFVINEGNDEQLVSALTRAGLPKEEASELARSAASEKPTDMNNPLGKSVKSWLIDKLNSGAAEAWGIGKTVLQSVVTEALKQYYGLDK